MTTLRFLLFALVVALGTRAAAEDSTADENVRAAMDEFANGKEEFTRGHWQRAVDAWQRGYGHKPDAVFLYNIAQAYRAAGDVGRALQFFHRYLRESPDATNRAEVAARIQQLEQLPLTAPSPTPTPTPTPTPAPTPSPSPPVEAPPVWRERGEVALVGGVGLSAVGVPGGVPASALFGARGAATVWRRGRVELAVGGMVTYTYLSDGAARDSFLSLLAVPTVRVDLWRQRLSLTADVGVGAQIVAGVPRGSALLRNDTDHGAFASFVARPALALDYAFARSWALSLSPALSAGPAPSAWSGSALLRLEITVALAYRFGALSAAR